MYRITLTDVSQKVDFGVEINCLFFFFTKKSRMKYVNVDIIKWKQK